MKTINPTEVKGLLNFVGQSSNFFEEYDVVDNVRLFCSDRDINDLKFGIFCSFKNSKNTLKVDVSSRSYYNMKFFLDKHTKYIPHAHKLFNILVNFGKIKIVAAIVTSYDKGHFITYMIFENDGKFLCTDCFFTDAVCIMQSCDFPIYVHQEIVYFLGTDSELLKKEALDA